MDLTKMTSAELKNLREDIDAAIIDRQRQDYSDAKAAAEAAVAEFGFSLADLIDAKKPAAKSKAAPKYKNPEDHSQTWSGRGRKPIWLVTALENGAEISDLEI